MVKPICDHRRSPGCDVRRIAAKETPNVPPAEPLRIQRDTGLVAVGATDLAVKSSLYGGSIALRPQGSLLQYTQLEHYLLATPPTTINTRALALTSTRPKPSILETE